MVDFSMSMSYPAVALSQRIYYDASRWEELIAENRTIHPLFMRRSVRGLSI
jgi:prophage DNA circulation protein